MPAMTKFQQAAALVAIAGLTVGVGVAVALPQSEDPTPASAVAESPTTTRERPTTTMRPTTTTAPVARATPTTMPPVVVYEAPAVEPYRPGCDAACTEDIMDGYGNGGVTTYTPTCTPSTLRGCDPDEPMDLPTIGCDYLERTLTGDVRCVD